jgi:two-component system phosphate regulon sensor histidine kinase PhoR
MNVRALILAALVGAAALAFAAGAAGTGRILEWWSGALALVAAGLTVADIYGRRRAAPVERVLRDVPVVSDTDRTASDRRFQTLVEALPAGVIVVEPPGRITAVNEAAAKMFGIVPARAIGRALIESIRSYELDRRVAAALSSGIEESGDLTFIAATERQLHVTTRAVERGDGRREALVVAVDRTRVMELESIRRDFVSNVSHELRSPLTAIKIMTETLQGGVDAQAGREFLDNIARETDRMVALVEDLLDLARLESGKLDLRFASVDLGALCKEAVATQLSRAQRVGVDLEAIVPPSPVTIAGDRDKLMQIVVNLLDNALRHTPPTGRVTVTVRESNGAREIEVADNGSGIPSDALPHVFERFYVVDRSRAKSKGGTGLGLAIVKHIVEAHAGVVGAESDLGRGSVFRCRFPA